MRSRKLTCASINFIVVLLSQSVHSQLQVGFYGNSCSLAEFIVKDEVRNSFFRDQGVAAGLVRLHVHDCFVRVSKRAKITYSCHFGFRISSNWIFYISLEIYWRVNILLLRSNFLHLTAYLVSRHLKF